MTTKSEMHNIFLERLDSLSITECFSYKDENYSLGVPFGSMSYTAQKKYLLRYCYILENSYDNWKKKKSSTVPDADTLYRIAEHFHTSIDYLLGKKDEQRNYDEKFIEEYLGLNLNAIRMLHLIHTNKKYPELNQRCIDMLNLLLSDFYIKIKDAGGNNDITHQNIFSDMWEYTHADLAYYSNLNDEVELDEEKKYMYVGFDKDYSKMLSISPAVKFNSQKSIFSILDKLSEQKK